VEIWLDETLSKEINGNNVEEVNFGLQNDDTDEKKTIIMYEKNYFTYRITKTLKN